MADGKQQLLLRSFVEVPRYSHFHNQNLPWGLPRDGAARLPEDPLCPALAIEDFALDLAAGLFDGPVLSGSPFFR